MSNTVLVDITAKGLPKFIEKENNPENQNGYMLCTIQTKENETWEGRVVSVSTSGKYLVELINKL